MSAASVKHYQIDPVLFDALLLHFVQDQPDSRGIFPARVPQNPAARHAGAILKRNWLRIDEIRSSNDGWVYFLRSERPLAEGDQVGKNGPKGTAGRHFWKIGLSIRPERRKEAVASVCGIPLYVVKLIGTDDMRSLELFLHRTFESRWLNHEWFDLDNVTGDTAAELDRWMKIDRFDFNPSEELQIVLDDIRRILAGIRAEPWRYGMQGHPAIEGRHAA